MGVGVHAEAAGSVVERIDAQHPAAVGNLVGCTLHQTPVAVEVRIHRSGRIHRENERIARFRTFRHIAVPVPEGIGRVFRDDRRERHLGPRRIIAVGFRFRNGSHAFRAVELEPGGQLVAVHFPEPGHALAASVAHISVAVGIEVRAVQDPGAVTAES